MAYDEPNYTQIPNTLLDDHLSTMKEAELKVILAIARKTFGWHKQGDRISLSQLMTLTGMSSQGVRNGIEAGMKRGTIARSSVGQSFIYHLVISGDRPTVPSMLLDEEKTALPSSAVGLSTALLGSAVLCNEVARLDEKPRYEVATQKKDNTKETIKRKLPETAPTLTPIANQSDHDGSRFSLRDVESAYENNIGMFSAMTADIVRDANDFYGSAMIIEAIKEATKQNVRKWSYVDGILKRWHANGRTGPRPARTKTWATINETLGGVDYA